MTRAEIEAMARSIKIDMTRVTGKSSKFSKSIRIITPTHGGALEKAFIAGFLAGRNVAAEAVVGTSIHEKIKALGEEE